MLIAVRADASPNMGAGHVMRCLTLAQELAARGCRTRFVAALMPPALAEAIRSAGHELVEIAPSDPGVHLPGWDRAAASADEQVSDAGRTRAALEDWQPDWLIVDHYRLDMRWEEEAKPAGAKLLVIDDLANRPHACGLLLDQTLGRRAEDYRGLVPESCTVLAGPRFALLRPEFAEVRPAALARRRRTGDVDGLLISLGATDIGGATAKVLEAATDAGLDCRIDVGLGASAPSRSEVEQIAARHANVSLHIDSRDMAKLMSEADVAIGAAGSSAWERCCLGLPSVMLTVADNQRLIASNLEALGAAIAVGDWKDAAPAALRLIRDPKSRERMVAAAAAVTEGRGVQSVADAMLAAAPPRSGALVIRPAGESDSEQLWIWRNDPLMRAVAKSHDAVPWSDHERWFARCTADDGCVLLIGDVEGVPVGMVRFDRDGSGLYTVSINVAPDGRGRGIGGRLLGAACRWLEDRHGPTVLQAEIMDGNSASGRIFAGNGFVPAGSGSEPGYGRYLRAAASAGHEFGLAPDPRSSN